MHTLKQQLCAQYLKLTEKIQIIPHNIYFKIVHQQRYMTSQLHGNTKND